MSDDFFSTPVKRPLPQPPVPQQGTPWAPPGYAPVPPPPQQWTGPPQQWTGPPQQWTGPAQEWPGPPQWAAKSGKHRAAKIIGLTLCVALVAVVMIGAAVHVYNQQNRHLHLVAGAGLIPTTNAALQASLRNVSTAQAARLGFSVAAFDRPDGGEVIIGGGDLHGNDSATDKLHNFAAGFTDSLVRQGGALTPYTPAASGPRGGKVECAQLTRADGTQVGAVCIYTDDSTAGLMINGGADEESTAALLGRYRVAEEN